MKLIVVVISLFVTGTLFSSDLLDKAEKMIQERKDGFEQLPVFLEAAKKAKYLELVEGLPRLKSEIDKEEIFQVQGYWFYKRIVEAGANDKSLIKEILSDENTYRVYGGVKFCGGFHPDFCVGLQNEEGTTQYLICFGCHEIKAYAGEFELYAELTDEGYDALHEILMPYAGQTSSKNTPDAKTANQPEQTIREPARKTLKINRTN